MSVLANKGEPFRIRYLDSLDSIRFNINDLFIVENRILQRSGQALIEMCATILMGNGIIVSPNQLIDSYAFLRIASEIIHAAEKNNKEEFIPLYYSHYDYRHEFPGESPIKTPSLLVRHLFSKENYELSTWTCCEKKRLEWAERFGDTEEAFIPIEMVRGDDERRLTNDLTRIINHFEKHPEKVNTAGKVGSLRTDFALKISKIDNKKLESDNFLSKIILDDDRYKKISDIILVIRELAEIRDSENNRIIDNRSKVRRELSSALKYNDPKNIFKNVDGIFEEICTGVLKTIDIIYNHSMYIASSMDRYHPHSQQENITEPNDIDGWSYDEAGYALGIWVIQGNSDRKMERTSRFVSDSDFQVKEKDIDVNFINGDFDVFWENFFSFKESPEFIKSMNSYQYQLKLLQSDNKRLSCHEKTQKKIFQVEERKKKYIEVRNHHLDLLNNMYLDKYHYRIALDGAEANLLHYNEHVLDLKVRIEDFSEEINIPQDIANDIDNDSGKGKTYDS